MNVGMFKHKVPTTGFWTLRTQSLFPETMNVVTVIGLRVVNTTKGLWTSSRLSRSPVDVYVTKINVSSYDLNPLELQNITRNSDGQNIGSSSVIEILCPFIHTDGYLGFPL